MLRCFRFRPAFEWCSMNLEQRVNQVINDVLAREKIVGLAVRVYQSGKPIYERDAGHADREKGIAVQPDTIFRLASVTKPILAATALAMADKGLIDLQEPVSHALPWFHPKTADGKTPDITIHQLLTHTSGLIYDPALEMLPADRAVYMGLLDCDLDFEANFSRHNAIPLAFAPGTYWAYSFGPDIVGAALAKVHGGSLEDAIVHHITGPLGMAGTRFHATDPARLSVAYGDATPKPVVMTEPWYPSEESGWTAGFSPSRIFNPKAFQSGGGGMAGTADDVVRLIETIRAGGGSILKTETTKAGLSNQIGDVPGLPGARFGYFGQIITDPVAAETSLPVGAMQWGGVYGNTWFIDPASKLTVVSLSNTALEGCMGDYPELLRKAVFQAVN